jgi:hypothetical protein
MGLNVELSIAWPALLHHLAPMQLVVSGRIVRIHGNRIAIHMSQHEFRTAGSAGEHRGLLVSAARASSAGFKPHGFGKTETLQ